MRNTRISLHDCPSCGKKQGVKVKSKINHYLEVFVTKCTGCNKYHTFSDENKLIPFVEQ